MKKFGEPKNIGGLIVGAALMTAVGSAQAADPLRMPWQVAQAQPAAKPDAEDAKRESGEKGEPKGQDNKGQQPRRQPQSAPDQSRSNQRDERRSQSDAKQPRRSQSESGDPKGNADAAKSDQPKTESRPDRSRQPASQADRKAEPQELKPRAKSPDDTRPANARRPADADKAADKSAADKAAEKSGNQDKSADRDRSPNNDRRASPATPPGQSPPAGAADAGRKQPVEQRTSPSEQRQQAAPGVAPSGRGPASADAAPQRQPKGLDEVRRGRRETKEDGGRATVITEPGDRKIIRQDNRIIIKHDEAQRFQGRRFQSRSERGPDGLNILISAGPAGVEIVNVTNRDGRLVRRYRRHRDGREVTLIDNRSYISRHPGAYAALPKLALGAIALSIPRKQYIVEYEDASEDDIYQALSAPPVERLERRYSLEEIRYSHSLRERLRRVDLDDITFETGAWEIDQAQMAKLDRVARVMKRIIEREPTTVFLIEGHTDSIGSEEDNLTLSDRRAEAVANALTDEFDVPPESLVTQGYGEAHLKVQSDAAERANRRASVRNVTKVLAQK